MRGSTRFSFRASRQSSTPIAQPPRIHRLSTAAPITVARRPNATLGCETVRPREQRRPSCIHRGSWAPTIRASANPSRRIDLSCGELSAAKGAIKCSMPEISRPCSPGWSKNGSAAGSLQRGTISTGMNSRPCSKGSRAPAFRASRLRAGRSDCSAARWTERAS